MSSAPSLHAPKRLSAVEACRVLAGEVWRRERKLEDFRSGGLNSEKAVRQRLQSVAMEMQRAPGLDDKVALHLYSIDWLNADPLTILERTEGLLDRQCRDTYPSVEALLRESQRATQLAVRLLVLQGIAGRIGRWAVRAGEIPDARIARTHYRELGAPEWSQFCRLTDEANAAFDRADYVNAAAKAFDADRLVRTPASLLMASVALSRLADFVGALWAIRVCLLEPEESFESPAAHRKARTLEARLREIVQGRINIGTAEESLLDQSSQVVAVGVVDIVEERQDILETESPKLQGSATAAPAKRSDRWGERYLVSDLESTPTPDVVEQVLLTPKPNAETRKDVVTLCEPSEQPIPTQPSSPEHVRLIERERVMNEASFFEQTLDPPLPRTELETPRSAQSILESESMLRLVSETYDVAFAGEEVTYIPAGPSIDVLVEDFREETEIPPDPELRRLREQAMQRDPRKVEAAVRAISAAAGLRLEELTLRHETGEAKRIPASLLEAPTLHEGSPENAKVEERAFREEVLERINGLMVEPPLPEAVLEKKLRARAPTATTERIIRRVIPANQPEERTDVLGTLTLPMGQHTRETALASLDREESSLSFASEEATAQIRTPLKRVYETTQIVRARHAKTPEPEIESQTEQLSSRSPFDPPR